jgi:hypothetical protein
MTSLKDKAKNLFSENPNGGETREVHGELTTPRTRNVQTKVLDTSAGVYLDRAETDLRTVLPMLVESVAEHVNAKREISAALHAIAEARKHFYTVEQNPGAWGAIPPTVEERERGRDKPES